MITYFNLTNMEPRKHFSHPHTLSFYKGFEAELTCDSCNLPCNRTPVYSCHACRFFLHEHCASFPLNPNPSTPPPNQIKLKSHPNHPLKYLPELPSTSGLPICEVCGTGCDRKGALYRCDICDYDVHVTCTTLPESVHREDHAHALSLLYVNPSSSGICDVCRGWLSQNNCLYHCSSGCDYGIHVKCVLSEVTDMDDPDIWPGWAALSLERKLGKNPTVLLENMVEPLVRTPGPSK
ncbi:putative chromatin regulator PHD family [Helianthus debilis subsp. tardiflorus]